MISLLSFVCILGYPSDFNETSKLHAMTRGVLFSSADPAKTLTEFNIDPSYELLADASAYDYLPFVRSVTVPYTMALWINIRFPTSEFIIYAIRTACLA